MSVLLFAETENNKLKRNAKEVASYAYKLASQLNTSCSAITFCAENAKNLGKHGVTYIYNVKNAPKEFDAYVYANAINEILMTINATHIIVSCSADAKFLAPILAAKTNAAYVSNVIALPHNLNPLTVKHTVFTNKAFSNTNLNADMNIIGVANNSLGTFENSVECNVENIELTDYIPKLEQVSVSKETGKATIADADVVVSGGRGLKGPENWHIIENLADVLGAATACSKPVSDMGWRSHDEHVGQTGKPVSTNLYIAIGISGAIQHLAGVNASKIKVVINNDPEAPFFKAADYGIIGDAFEVVPVLTEKLKAFKAQ
jgi:electron transfer flavoprotein alpha subunit